MVKFKKHYERFKQRSLYLSQKRALKKDLYLWELYNQNASKFIKDKKIRNITTAYISKVLHGTTFTSVNKLNAFTFLHFTLPIITPIYQFNFDSNAIKKILGKTYLKDNVISIQKNKEGYLIKTRKGKKFISKKLVLATTPLVAKQLLDKAKIKIKGKLRGPVNAHMFHVIGELINAWTKGDIHLFRDEERILAIAHQLNHSFLIYSIHKDINIKKYFHNYKILKIKHWSPAFHITGSNLLNFNQDKNLYLIGDNNITGLEPSYLYGKYCANKLLGKTKD